MNAEELTGDASVSSVKHPRSRVGMVMKTGRRDFWILDQRRVLCLII